MVFFRLFKFISGKLEAIFNYFCIGTSTSIMEFIYVGLTDHKEDGTWRWSSKNEVVSVGCCLQDDWPNDGDCAITSYVEHINTKMMYHRHECDSERIIVCEKSFYATDLDLNHLTNA